MNAPVASSSIARTNNGIVNRLPVNDRLLADVDDGAGSGSEAPTPVVALHRPEVAFEQSHEHFANITNSSVNAMGVGVAYARNVIYVTEEFMKSP
jgi:hypothetical protein